ncbi:MAG TPA: hydroxyacylglutathione hydrolase [Amaricoccus sp.]|uniref:hydroxyacylglutathione hydrolase n=1 Tax=Amaricoccus sp. TaxID=1872485 RepID=UPI001D7A5AE1|nr:hydroxyacylglutathione hydrolase [Amaricoccus sp.]MCB1375785.1 hydroxyacylglutathione hydrolase [Paracoccaceae bacterium]MCC0068038.1 hydroxyacylglutathione hydrolase [Rhodovulum sp.]MCB1404592.1 hydroxyacylglutathione hydrolase [Paracoccaceae bacterium]HPG23935.1 hydroxyacylglutathione hydrolase [Amaricoccus sp.]HRW15021.1 hydroxyacylglutathione hydrolase [Amaricoccus sp.]
MPLEIVTIPCRSDNYAYLLRDTATGRVGLVDAPEAEPIRMELARRGWGLYLILITHHHDDHIAGVDALRGEFGAAVVGAAADRARLPALDKAVADGDRVALGESAGTVFEVPGHTIGHVAYHFPASHALFSADSLMVMGCGRLFEGTAEQMWRSLARLAALPPETLVYSGHEYAESNLRFALSVDGENPALRARAEEVAALRARGEATVPARLDLEIATNPFLRARDPGMKARLGLAGAPDAAVFAEIRRRKDAFR